MGSGYQEIQSSPDNSKGRRRNGTYSSIIPYATQEPSHNESSEKSSLMLGKRNPHQKKAFFNILLSVFTFSFFALFATRSIRNSNFFQAENLKGNQIIDLIKDIPSTEYLQDFYVQYASHPSVAGGLAGHELAKWTRDKWQEFGLSNASIETYYPFLNYPKKRVLAIVYGPQELLHEATLLETEESIPTYHAYSASGNVTGPIVYVNYGRTEDFEWLKKKNIPVKGAIALIRHGLVPSSIKVYNAELAGCIGALIFVDPTEKAKSDDDSIPVVQRESVEYEFIHPGDPFTPGFAATLNATRLNETQSLAQIPSLPISWTDALLCLRATEGHGETKKSWNGVALSKYYTGPSVALANLVNMNEFKMKPIWNVVAQIKGHDEPEKAIVLGSHRDSLGDGADASSGSAVMLELIRVFGILLEKGWRPRRTIVFASWDANEYGNVGSTEWVEDHLDWLDKHVIAYLNLDNAITGSHFSVEGSPLLHRLMMQVSAMVIDPRTGESVYETWLSDFSSPSTLDNNDEDKDEDYYLPLVKPLGTTSGLDTLAFFEYAGISSLSLSFESGKDAHNSLWVEEFEDPLFEYHQTMVKLLGLLAYRLTDDILLPFYPVDYTLAMKQYLKELTTREPSDDESDAFKQKENKTLPNPNELPKMASALDKLYHTSMRFHEKVQGLDRMVITKHRSHKLLKHINKANERLVSFERALLNEQGLLMHRPWHRHAVYGPSIQTGFVEAFPVIQESRALGNVTVVKEMEKSVSHILENAKRALQGKKIHSFNDDNSEGEDMNVDVSFVE